MAFLAFPRMPTSPLVVLLATIPVALSSGTIFVFSVYSTQLADQCNLSSSVIANLNILATVGTSSGGLLAGLVTDRLGTRVPIFCSFIFLAAGYKWLHSLYLSGPSAAVNHLLGAMFMIGIGSVSSYFAALKAAALTFPAYKGTAQSVTISSFAVASFLFSWVHSSVYDGDVAGFLLCLSVSSAIMQFIGLVFISLDGLHTEHEPLSQEVDDADAGEDVPLVPTMSAQVYHEGPKSSHTFKHLTLRESLVCPALWIHFFLMAIIQGLGQMYIYTVGYITKAVHYHMLHSDIDPASVPPLHSLQSLHVSLIAAFSFLGRLSSGPITDTLMNKYNCQRHWVTAFGVIASFLGHIILSLPFDYWYTSYTSINNVLVMASSFIGFAYGLSFTTFPAILADLFSMKNYSFLWGLMYCSTLVGLTIFTKLFGYVYDRNSSMQDGDYICRKGSYCYISTFHVTSVLAVLVFCALLFFIRYRSR